MALSKTQIIQIQRVGRINSIDPDQQTIKNCDTETEHAQVVGTGFCRCGHVTYDEEQANAKG